MKHGQTFSSLFSEFDKDGNGEIDMMELEKGMQGLGISLDDEEAAALIDKFTNGDRSRRVRMRDFIQTLNFAASPEDARVHLVESLLERLRDVLAEKFGSSANVGAKMKETFEEMDPNGDMQLNATELQQGLKRLKIDMTIGEVGDIIDIYDDDRSGKIEYAEFLKLIGAAEKQVALDGSSNYVNSKVDSKVDSKSDESVTLTSESTMEALESVNVGEVVVRLYQRIITSSRGRMTMADLEGTFESVESPDSTQLTGYLPVDAFLRCLADVGMELESTDEKELISTIASREHICYKGFVSHIKKQIELNSTVDLVIEKFSRRIQREMKHGQTFSSLFSEFDKDGNGEIDMMELEKGMQGLGISLDDEEAAALIDKFTNGDRSRRVRMRDFIRTLNFAASPEDARVHLVESLLERLRDVLAEKFGSSANVGAKMKETFEEMDPNGDMQLNATELQQGLKRLKIDMTI